MWIIFAALLFALFCMALCALFAALGIGRYAWLFVEYLANGVVGGVRLFCVGAFWLFVASWRLSRWSRRQWKRLGLLAAQWTYARLYGGGYRWERRYIAGELRRKRAHNVRKC